MPGPPPPPPPPMLGGPPAPPPPPMLSAGGNNRADLLSSINDPRNGLARLRKVKDDEKNDRSAATVAGNASGATKASSAPSNAQRGQSNADPKPKPAFGGGGGGGMDLSSQLAAKFKERQMNGASSGPAKSKFLNFNMLFLNTLI